ncbi:MAG: NAD(P)H-binding protein [Pseudomonadota bacterium]
MSHNLYVITGATGHVGHVLAQRLLENKQTVRVVGRSRERLQALVDHGAEPFVADLEDGPAMKKAFSGAHAVYAMIPPNMGVSGFRAWQNKVARSQTDAVHANDVPYVMTLSSIGAHLSEGAGPVNGLHDMEQTFNALKNTHVLHLRPGMFMENLLMNVGMVKQMGMLAAPVRPEVAMTLIATQDIGELGARRMLALDWTGQEVLELQGSEDVTYPMVAKALGEVIGKPDLPYVQLSYEDATQGMVGMGLPEEIVGLYMEMYRGINDGKAGRTQPRSARTTTPTSVLHFAKTFAQVYSQA